jgi:hypothetical protein
MAARIFSRSISLLVAVIFPSGRSRTIRDRVFFCDHQPDTTITLEPTNILAETRGTNCQQSYLAIHLGGGGDAEYEGEEGNGKQSFSHRRFPPGS